MHQAFLSSVDLFRNLPPDSVDFISRNGTESTFPEGQILVREGEATGIVYALRHGRADVEMELPGGYQTETLATLKPGAVIGELALLGHPRRCATVRARDPVQVLGWESSWLITYLEERPAEHATVMRNLARVLANRLADTNLALRNEFSRSH